jgi:hypothetical protein
MLLPSFSSSLSYDIQRLTFSVTGCFARGVVVPVKSTMLTATQAVLAATSVKFFTGAVRFGCIWGQRDGVCDFLFFVLCFVVHNVLFVQLYLGPSLAVKNELPLISTLKTVQMPGSLIVSSSMLICVADAALYPWPRRSAFAAVSGTIAGPRLGGERPGILCFMRILLLFALALSVPLSMLSSFS